MFESKLPKQPGIYTLIIEIAYPIREKIGKLNSIYFSEGYYAYTGSALGRSVNLKTRLSRHLTFKKKKRWHIEYLLGAKTVTIRAIIFFLTSIDAECQIVKSLKNCQGIIIINGFGSSDCHSKCLSHLCCLPKKPLDNVIAEISNVYKKIFNAPPILIY